MWVLRACLTLFIVAGALLAQDAAAFARALCQHGYSDLAYGVAESVLLDGRMPATERVAAAEVLFELASRASRRGDDGALQRLSALLPRSSEGVQAQDPVEGVRFLLVEALVWRLDAEARLRAAESILAGESTRVLARRDARELQESVFALEARLARVPNATDARREARKSASVAELRLCLLGMRVQDLEEGRGLPPSELVARIEGLLLDLPEAGSAFRRIYLDGLLLLARTDLASGRVESAFTAAREVLQLLELNATANSTTMGLAERATLVLLSAGMRAPALVAEARHAAARVLAAPAGIWRGELLMAAGDAALLVADEPVAGQCFCAALGHEGVRALALRRVLEREDSTLPDAALQKVLAQDSLHWPALREPVLALLGRARHATTDAAHRLRLDRWLAELFLAAGDPDSSARHALLAAEVLRASEPEEARKLTRFARSLSAWTGPRMRLLAEDLSRGLGLDAALNVAADTKRDVLADLATRCDAALAAKNLDLAARLFRSLEREGAERVVLLAGQRSLATLALELFMAAPAEERDGARTELLKLALPAIATGAAADFQARLIVQLVAEREVVAARLCLPQDESAGSPELAEAAFIASMECASGCSSEAEVATVFIDAVRWHARLGPESPGFLLRRRRAEALFTGGILIRPATGFVVTHAQGAQERAANLWAALLAGTDPDSPLAWEARWYHLHFMLLSSVRDASAVECVGKELSRLAILTGGRFDEGAWEQAFIWLKARLP